MKKFLATLMTLVCVIGCMLALASCGDEQAESIALNKTELTLEVGENETLTATVSPETAVDKTVTWESSAPEIASVDGGKVTAKAAGTATITAKTSNDKSATCTVTVKLSLTEQTDFASLKSDKVTETQWKAAFSDEGFANCTISWMNGNWKTVIKRQTKERNRYVCTFTGKRSEDVDYYTLEDGENYAYYYRENEWIRQGPFIFDWFVSFYAFFPDFGKYYDEFIYDESKSAYVYNGEGLKTSEPGSGAENRTFTDITLKFVDGRIAYIKYNNDGKYHEETVYNYERTTVELPQNFAEKPGFPS